MLYFHMDFGMSKEASDVLLRPVCCRRVLFRSQRPVIYKLTDYLPPIYIR